LVLSCSKSEISKILYVSYLHFTSIETGLKCPAKVLENKKTRENRKYITKDGCSSEK